MKAINLVRVIIVTAGLVLLASVFFDFNQKVSNWETFRVLLMVICGAGWLFFLFYYWRIGDKKKVREMLLVFFILLAVSLLSWFWFN